LLALLARRDEVPFAPDERALLLARCFHGNHQQMIDPFEPYVRLRELARIAEDAPDAAEYLSDRYLRDLATWYHLSWTGETVRREEPLIGELMTIGSGFSHAQRLSLLDLMGRVVREIIPRFRRLQRSGRVELSTTPYFHPLAPLLIEFESARQALPGLPLPAAAQFPGGEHRVDRHIDRALRDHEERFGMRPTGMWPAEGAVSDRVVARIGRAGLGWVASGEQVLANSLRRAGIDARARETFLYRPYRLPDLAPETLCFFRDDHLSDLIGFEYRRWDGHDAAAHFVQQLERLIPAAGTGRRPVVSVILDGENAWEHYAFNGYYFLSALYERLGSHREIRMCTYRDWLDEHPRGEREGIATLPGLVAGSWVYGDLTTWIGSADKNAAWDLLASAKQAYDQVVSAGTLAPAGLEAAERQLSVCESSDWFWWFGDYNSAQSVTGFDRLYRDNLAELYRLLGLAVPANLSLPISRGSVSAEGDGSMRRAS
jgi:alpha-amylase/alpha-mannosidase (GH57 family)